MLDFKTALLNINKTVGVFYYYISDSGNLSCKNIDTGTQLFFSDTSQQWVAL